MATSRIALHEILCKILESRNVYFQPPESVKMKYPAIVYGLSGIENTHAGNKPYLSKRKYSITIIDEDPDSPIVGKFTALPVCRFDRFFKSDNLNHNVFTLYF